MTDRAPERDNYPQNIPAPAAAAAEPKNEDAICAAVDRFIEERRGESLKEVCRPDKEGSLQKNVELVRLCQIV